MTYEGCGPGSEALAAGVLVKDANGEAIPLTPGPDGELAAEVSDAEPEEAAPDADVVSLATAERVVPSAPVPVVDAGAGTDEDVDCSATEVEDLPAGSGKVTVTPTLAQMFFKVFSTAEQGGKSVQSSTVCSFRT